MAELNTPVTSCVFSLYGVEAVVFEDYGPPLARRWVARRPGRA